MKRLWSVLSLFLVLARPAAAAEHTLPVTINGFAGMPADSSDRREFLQGFHEAMDADLPCEQRKGDTWSSSGLRSNSFRLVDATPPEAAWTLDLSVGVPPVIRIARAKPKHGKLTPRPRISDVRTSRGLTIVVTALSPGAATQGDRPAPQRFAVYFADARRIVVPSTHLPSGGYDYPWADAGRVVARAALEALHRAQGELSQDERADLEPATRTQEQP